MLEALVRNRLAYHPRFLVCPDTDRLLLIAETNSYLLPGQRYITLHRQLQAGSTDASSMDDPFTRLDAQAMATLLKSSEELAALDILRDSASLLEDEGAYSPLDLTIPPSTIAADTGAQCIWLARPSTEMDAVRSALESLPDDLLVIVVEDWLDPRLKPEVNSAHRRCRNVLIVKYSGQQPAIGPYLPREETDGVHRCIACFQHRLKANQPWRHWYERRHGLEYTPVPIPRPQHPVADVFAQVVDGWSRHGRRLRDVILQAEARSEKALFWQSRCANHTGNSETAVQHIPIEIRDTGAACRDDGGFRQCPPAATLQRLQPLIDPVTGIISHLQRINSGTALPVYSAGFFKRQEPGSPYEPSSNHVLTLGKGFSDEQSRASAACEAVERWAAQWQGSEPQVDAAPAGLQSRYLLPQQLAPFSARQYEQFLQRSTVADGDRRQAVKRFPVEGEMVWVSAWSLTEDEPVYLPRDYVYAVEDNGELPFCRWNSNGCATGNTVEEAILQGLLEVVERDAVAIWWYNKRPAGGIARAQLPDSLRDAIENTLGEQWNYWLLNITPNSNIPVVVAVARHRDNGEYRLGYGCHVDGRLAVQRAVTELAQIMAIGGKGPRGFEFSAIPESPFLHPLQSLSAPQWPAPPDTIGQAINYCLDALAREKLEVLVHHYPRDLPLQVVKVIVPGACHIWPQLASPRLLSFSESGDRVINELALYM